MAERPSSKTVSTKQKRIAELARQMPGVPLTSLSHYIDIDWLRTAYARTRKDGATGVDDQTAAEYAMQLEDNLRSLLGRAKSGDHYRAPPVRRVHIPKGDGRTRPIGIPTFEDKLLQRAVVMLLEPVYEQDFLDCSYGFRPGRGAHGALEAVWNGLMAINGGWVLEADIEDFFGSVDHGHLRQMLSQRVRDGVVLRLVGKWLNAGVMEQGSVYHPETGTPQGGVISPLLANVYLHEVLDVWFERDVRPRMRGRTWLVRYADDFVMAFELEEDARRVLDVLPKRFSKYGLRLHPTKTRLLKFRRPQRQPLPPKGDLRRPETLDFLGFTLHWGRSRRGSWMVQRKTSSERFSRAVRRLKEWCRDNRHLPLQEQHRVLSLKLRGHDAYYGVTGNYRLLALLRHCLTRIWFKWLKRRSSKSWRPWAWMETLMKRLVLPRPRVVHSTLHARAAKP